MNILNIILAGLLLIANLILWARLRRIIEVAKKDRFGRYQYEIQVAFEKEVVAHFRKEFRDGIESRVNLEIEKAAETETIKQLDKVAEEFAETYTKEYFEVRMKEQVSEMVKTHVKNKFFVIEE